MLPITQNRVEVLCKVSIIKIWATLLRKTCRGDCIWVALKTIANSDIC